MNPFPLTKTCNPADFGELSTEVSQVSAIGLGEQHPMRLWEYAMGLRAFGQWLKSLPAKPSQLTVLDVGGAGSTFGQIFTNTVKQGDVQVVDPRINSTLEAFTLPKPAEVIFCISTIEHVKNYRPFLRSLASHLCNGGLLFITTDYWNCNGKDEAHFHWMRERIYNRDTIKKVILECNELGLSNFGKTDWTYHGNHVYDYTFFALTLIKERRAHVRPEAN